MLPQPSSVMAITVSAFGPFSMKLMSRSNGSLSISAPSGRDAAVSPGELSGVEHRAVGAHWSGNEAAGGPHRGPPAASLPGQVTWPTGCSVEPSLRITITVAASPPGPRNESTVRSDWFSLYNFTLTSPVGLFDAAWPAFNG